MDNKQVTRQIIAALFFLAGIGLTLWVIFVIGVEKGFTQQKYVVEVLFHKVDGLIEGAPVRLSGVTVGNVSSINFLDKEVQGRRISVKMKILSRFKKQLDANVAFFIKSEGILGDKLIEINVLGGDKRIDYSKPIFGSESVNVQAMTEVFAGAAQSFTATSDALRSINFQDLSIALKEAADSLQQTSGSINDAVDELQYITIKSKRLLNRVEEKLIDGDLFKVF